MNNELRQHLEAKRDKEVQATAQLLLADNTENAADIDIRVRHIEAYTKLLTVIGPRPSREWIWAGIVALVCIAGASLLWSLHVRKTKITFHIQTEALEIMLGAPWSWSGNLPLETNLVRFEALTTLSGLALGTPIENPKGDAWIEVRGGDASLKQLDLGSSSVLAIERGSNGHLDCYVRGTVVKGRFIVWGESQLSVGEDTMAAVRTLKTHRTGESIEVPETIEFRAQVDKAPPMRFQARPREPWILRNVPVQNLSFSQEFPGEPGERSFVSTILKGTLTLHDIAETLTLREQDRLSLTGVQGRVVELRAEDSINVIFEGTAEEILIGPPGGAQNRAPSYLEYFYHQKPLAFFWSAIIFLWGILWSVRRTMFT